MALKLCYIHSAYESLARAASEYARVLKPRYEFTAIRDSDVIILHCLPEELDAFFREHRALLNRYLIIYCYWEATELPECLKLFTSFAREVWTCSRYCKMVFEKYHPSVTYVPHIVRRDLTYSDEDIWEMKRLIAHTEDHVYFLTIASLKDKRKNVGLLVREFHRLSSAMPHARLIVKTHPMGTHQQIIRHRNVTYISQRLTECQLNALYALADCYVSVHHSEAWGLTLSDSMLFGKPVIATGYSGNMEFMNSDNSFPLRYEEEYIHSDDQWYLFNGKMKWAYPDVRHLSETLLRLYQHTEESLIRCKVERARQDIQRFNDRMILEIIGARLEGVGAHLKR